MREDLGSCDRGPGLYAGGGDNALRRLAAIPVPPQPGFHSRLLGPDIPRTLTCGKGCAKCQCPPWFRRLMVIYLKRHALYLKHQD